jgi:hypothetical protein
MIGSVLTVGATRILVDVAAFDEAADRPPLRLLAAACDLEQLALVDALLLPLLDLDGWP